LFPTQDEPEGGSGLACWELTVNLENGERLSLEQIRALLEACQEVRFEAANRQEVYDWVTRVCDCPGPRGHWHGDRALVPLYQVRSCRLPPDRSGRSRAGRPLTLRRTEDARFPRPEFAARWRSRCSYLHDARALSRRTLPAHRRGKRPQFEGLPAGAKTRPGSPVGRRRVLNIRCPAVERGRGWPWPLEALAEVARP
jgi:hypothetical protein